MKQLICQELLLFVMLRDQSGKHWECKDLISKPLFIAPERKAVYPAADI